MSARALLRLLLLVQAGAVGALAWAAMHWFGWGDGAALLLALGALALVRLAINLNNFRLSARAASATPAPLQLDRRAGLRLFGEEFSASMRASFWHMPRAAARQRVFPDAAVPPVLLLHGYGCNSGYWTDLLPRLEAAGISYATLDLHPVTGAIDGFVPQVEAGAQALLDASAAPRITLVGHSMGGLVARAWLRAHGGARVARVVTLGTPHAGTALAAFGVGANAAQMRHGGAWLAALAASESAATRALIVSFYSHHDNIVAPQTSSHLAGARNVGVGGIGHVALGSNARMLAMVMRELAAAAQAPALVIAAPASAARAALAQHCAAQGYRVLCTDSAAEAQALLADPAVQALLCTAAMDLLDAARASWPSVQRILLAASAQDGTAALADGSAHAVDTFPWRGAALAQLCLPALDAPLL